MAETTEEPQALPGDGLREGIVDELRRRIGEALVDVELRPNDDLWVRVATDAWAATGEALRGMGFSYFCFLSGIDWLPSPYGRSEDNPDEPPPVRSTEVVQGVTGGATRFQVFARVVDPLRHVGITLKADVADDAMAIGSWHTIYAGANWHERETHEMFGIDFAGHPDLRNMYLPTEFEGYPLRKDFPLLSRMIKPWPGIVDVEPMPAEDEDGDGVAHPPPDEASGETPSAATAAADDESLVTATDDADAVSEATVGEAGAPGDAEAADATPAENTPATEAADDGAAGEVAPDGDAAAQAATTQEPARDVAATAGEAVAPETDHAAEAASAESAADADAVAESAAETHEPVADEAVPAENGNGVAAGASASDAVATADEAVAPDTELSADAAPVETAPDGGAAAESAAATEKPTSAAVADDAEPDTEAAATTDEPAGAEAATTDEVAKTAEATTPDAPPAGDASVDETPPEGGAHAESTAAPEDATHETPPDAASEERPATDDAATADDAAVATAAAVADEGAAATDESSSADETPDETEAAQPAADAGADVAGDETVGTDMTAEPGGDETVGTDTAAEPGGDETVGTDAAAEPAGADGAQEPGAWSPDIPVADVEGPFGVGSKGPRPDGSPPVDHPIKAVMSSMRFCVPGSEGYDDTEPDVWFDSQTTARQAGFLSPYDDDLPGEGDLGAHPLESESNRAQMRERADDRADEGNR